MQAIDTPSAELADSNLPYIPAVPKNGADHMPHHLTLALRDPGKQNSLLLFSKREGASAFPKAVEEERMAFLPKENYASRV